MNDTGKSTDSNFGKPKLTVGRIIKTTLRKIMLYAILIIAGTFLTLSVILFFFQDRLVFAPSHNVFATPAAYKIDFEDISLKTTSGETINCWYVPAENAKYTVLFCHGNAGNLAHRLDTAAFYHAEGFNFMIFDYPGYGKSSGKPSDKGVIEAAETAWKYLTETMKLPPDRIIVIGRSMGGAAASHLAAKYHPAMLCSEAAFISVAEVGKDIVPFIPVFLLCRVNLPTGKNIKKVKCPILIIHSPHDEIIKYRHGKALFEMANHPKEFHTLKGGHNDCWFIDQTRYAEIIKSFVDKYCDGKKLTPESDAASESH